ncbi:MAG: hypothetical protein WC459_04025 [Patescibacteria group bacterium]
MKNISKFYILLSIIVIAGIFIYLPFVKNKIKVQGINKNNSSEENNNQGGFARYYNAEAGYSFQYPNYFEYNEKSKKPNFIFFYSKLDGADIITVSRRSIEVSVIKTVEDWSANMYKEGYYKMKDAAIENTPAIIVLDNVDKNLSFQDRYLNIGFVKDGYIFSINLRGFTEEQALEFIDNFQFEK